MHHRRALLIPLLLSLLTVCSAAGATVVERVIAVVGEQAILLSDLRARARPFLIRIYEQVPPGAKRNAAISQLYAQLLERMVEDELEQRAANRANISVTAREIDDALARIAAQNDVSVRTVLDEAKRSGLTERQYRQEIRRQLLEAKLLNLRVQGRLRVSEEDLRSTYNRLVKEERRSLPFRAAWIRIDAPKDAPAKTLRQRREKAESIVEQARAGADFAELARRHSDDARTRTAGGLLGSLRPGQLPPTLDSVVLSLQVGQVSEPVRHGDDFVILKVIERSESQLPAFAEVRQELGQRVYMEKMEKARNAWLKGLKRRIHVDVRL